MILGHKKGRLHFLNCHFTCASWGLALIHLLWSNMTYSMYNTDYKWLPLIPAAWPGGHYLEFRALLYLYASCNNYHANISSTMSYIAATYILQWLRVHRWGRLPATIVLWHQHLQVIQLQLEPISRIWVYVNLQCAMELHSLLKGTLSIIMALLQFLLQFSSSPPPPPPHCYKNTYLLWKYILHSVF